MKALKVLLITALLASCGSAKKSVNENIEQNSSVVSATTIETATDVNLSAQNTQTTTQTQQEVVEDSTETWTFTTTKWYDTEKADSNGNAPVLKEETVASVSFHGNRKRKDSEDKSSSENQSLLAATRNKKVESGVSAESSNRSTTQRNKSVTNDRPIIYIGIGIFLALLMAILAYWVFSKYRQHRSVKQPFPLT